MDVSHVILLLLASLVASHATNDKKWQPATATWYGSPEGDGSSGGACGYGPLVSVSPLKARVGAASPILFKNGLGCGQCYKVKCQDKTICKKRAVTIVVTDECPDGGYCSNGRTHFDMSGAAFGRLAINSQTDQLRNRGVIPVVFKRTACKYHGKNIAFRVNEGSSEFWLSLLVHFVDGDGDVGALHIKEKNATEWLQMNHDWGATWTLTGQGPLKGPFSVKLTTLTSGRTLSVSDVIPESWSPQSTYTSPIRFMN